MRRLFTWLILLGGAFAPLTAQMTLQVPARADIPVAADVLVAEEASWRKEVVAAEQQVDLVDAWTTDSVLTDNRQYLSGGWGKMGRLLARYWEYMSPAKQKYVATCSREFKIYDGLAKEVDMNIFLMPHLPRYIAMVRDGFNQAFERGRSEKHYRYDNPGYPCPEELKFEELGYLTVECEGTPHEDYRAALSEQFLPTEKGKHYLGQHGNFGVKYPTLGLYGAWVMDCNHNCRPEIHPIDWMWWLDLSDDRPGSPHARSWMVGMVRDGSERFDSWSPASVAGEIVIPVAIPVGNSQATVDVDPLVYSSLDRAVLAEKWGARAAQSTSQSVRLEGDFGAPVELSVNWPEDSGEGLVWYLENFRFDPDRSLIYGEFHLAMATSELFTARITVDFLD